MESKQADGGATCSNPAVGNPLLRLNELAWTLRMKGVAMHHCIKEDIIIADHSRAAAANI